MNQSFFRICHSGERHQDPQIARRPNHISFIHGCYWTKRPFIGCLHPENFTNPSIILSLSYSSRKPGSTNIFKATIILADNDRTRSACSVQRAACTARSGFVTNGQPWFNDQACDTIVVSKRSMILNDVSIFEHDIGSCTVCASFTNCSSTLLCSKFCVLKYIVNNLATADRG